MLREYVFWFQLIKRNPLYFDSAWNNTRKLLKVVVTERQIRSDGPIGQIDHQDSLVIDLPNIDQISWSVTSPGSIGYITIITQQSEHYYLTPVNPFDPTLVLVKGNSDELIAFCEVVNALRTNQIPAVDENPYLRQLKNEDKPAYLMNRMDIPWEKNVSPWEYYHALVPASEEKKRRLVVKIYKFFILGGLIISILVFLYALYINFKW